MSLPYSGKAVPKNNNLYEPFLCCALLCNHIIKFITTTKNRKFSTMDVLVPIPMKNAAKCDKQCELQNSANHQIFERKWRQRDILPACLFQCLRGFTLILMWLTCWKIGTLLLLPSNRLSWKMRKWIFRSNEVVTSLECDFIGSTELSFLTCGIILIIIIRCYAMLNSI